MRQFKNIKMHPSKENLVSVEIDQEDWSDAEGLDKVIVRSPTQYVLSTDTINSSLAQNITPITDVSSQDPLVITTSGYNGSTLAAKDGLLVSSDGYTRARGIIKSSTSGELTYDSVAYTSTSDGVYYMLGGEANGVNTNDVWYSTSGTSWTYLGKAPWSARRNAYAWTSGSYIYIAGGFEDAGYAEDIWRGTINATNGITWESTAYDSGITQLGGFDRKVFVSDVNRLYFADGYYDFDADTVTSRTFSSGDGYSTIYGWDSKANMMWISDDGYRDEFILDDNGDVIKSYEHDDFATDGIYTHYQETASMNWDVVNGLANADVVVLVKNDNGEIMCPASATISSEYAKLTFSSAVKGYAWIIPGIINVTTDTINLSAENNLADNNIMIFGSDKISLIEPLTINHNTITLDSSTEVNYVILKPAVANEARGRRVYYTNQSYVSGNNDAAFNLNSGNSFHVFRDTSNYNRVFPASVTDKTEDTHVINMAAADTLNVYVSDNRHVGRRDLQEFWINAYTNANIGNDTVNEMYISMDIDDQLYASSNNGLTWKLRNTGFTALTTTPVWCEEDEVIIKENYRLKKSLDSGFTFTTTTEPFSTQTITFYDRLTESGTDIDTDYNVFIYQRPSDVVWQHYYGHTPNDILDDFSTHYILPYAAVITAATSRSVTFTSDSVYDRAIIADEFEDDWCYIYDVSASEWKRYRISANSAGATGSSIVIYLKESTDITITTSDLIQIVRQRPEGLTHYTALTVDADKNSLVLRESDDAFFKLDQERAYDYVWKEKVKTFSTMPQFIEADANNSSLRDFLLNDLERLSVNVQQTYNDTWSLTEDQLQSFASLMGLQVDPINFDLATLRRLLELVYHKVNLLGSCVDAVDNLFKLYDFDDINVHQSAGTGEYGLDLVVGVTGYGWDEIIRELNSIKYSSGAYLPVSLDVDPGVYEHYYLVHIDGGVLYDPVVITSHTSSGGTDKLFADISSHQINSSSILLVADEYTMRRFYAAIKLLKNITPNYLNIKYL